MTREEHDKDMIESIEMWLHEIEPKWVEKELAWLDELRNRLLEEDTSNDLEEAAGNHIREVVDAAGHPGWDWTTQDIADAFIAGTKWQKQHDAELIEIAYNDGITIGMTKQKEQMLKEAVEGEVIVPIYEGYADWSVEVKIPGRYEIGDKIRIIIIKEDEK